VTINQMANMVIAISGKALELVHVPGPTGVRGRNSDNRLIEHKLGWRPSRPFVQGLEVTYEWIERQVRAQLDEPRLALAA